MNQMKWYHILMSFVHAWYNPSLVNAIADCESEYSIIGSVIGLMISPMILLHRKDGQTGDWTQDPPDIYQML